MTTGLFLVVLVVIAIALLWERSHRGKETVDPAALVPADEAGPTLTGKFRLQQMKQSLAAKKGEQYSAPPERQEPQETEESLPDPFDSSKKP